MPYLLLKSSSMHIWNVFTHRMCFFGAGAAPPPPPPPLLELPPALPLAAELALEEAPPPVEESALSSAAEAAAAWEKTRTDVVHSFAARLEGQQIKKNKEARFVSQRH